MAAVAAVAEALPLVASRALAMAESLSYKGWIGVALATAILYLYKISTLARPGRDNPCPPYGAVFRIMYGLFSTEFAHYVLGSISLTKDGEQQAPSGSFDTNITTQGPPEMRVQLVPILGTLFGGNYSFLIWDEADPQRRAIVVDPADPHPVLQAAEREKLKVEVLLTTHWHFDHSAGNRTFKRRLPDLEVVASAAESGRTPAVTRRLIDVEEITCGRLTVRGHSVPGHTRGSMVYEVFSRAAPEAPSIAFTGDTLFCGGCGALFECSSNTLHNSLGALTQRLKPETLLYPGHEYSEMLMRMAVRREPSNEAAKAKLAQVRSMRSRREPSLPTTLRDELNYNVYLSASPQQLAEMCGAAYDD